MPVGRFRVAAAVYGVLVDRDRMLLMRRAGSGYRDGELSLPAGHLDGAEDALTGLLRELREELTITADRDSCRLAVLLHRAPESPGPSGRLDVDELQSLDPFEVLPVPRRERQAIPQADTRLHAVREPYAGPIRLQR